MKKNPSLMRKDKSEVKSKVLLPSTNMGSEKLMTNTSRKKALFFSFPKPFPNQKVPSSEITFPCMRI